MAELEQTVRRGEAPAFVWWAICAGPFAWAGDLGFSYALTQHSCSTGHHYVLHVITIVCALLAISGFVAGWSAYGALSRDATEEGPRPLDRDLVGMPGLRLAREGLEGGEVVLGHGSTS